MSLKNPYLRQREIVFEIWHRKRHHLFGVERWFLLGLAFSLALLPAMLVRFVGGRYGYLGRKRAVELWVFLKPAIVLVILSCHLAGHTWAMVVAVVLLADLYTYLLGLVFLTRYYAAPASYGRSILLLGANLLEAILSFAVLYLHYAALGKSGEAVRSWDEAVYFSVITTATVGYGDITPITAAGRRIVVAQVLTAFLFVAIVLTTFVTTWAGLRDRKRANKRYVEPTRSGRRKRAAHS